MRVTVRERVLPPLKRKGKKKGVRVRIYLDTYYGKGKRKLEAFWSGYRGTERYREMRDQANSIASETNLKQEAAEVGLPVRAKKDASFVDYYRTLASKRTSRNTRASWGNAINKLIEYAGPDIVFGQLTQKFFEGWKIELLSTVQQNSAWLYLSRIKSALNESVKDGLIASNPAQFVSIQKEESLPIFLTLEEVRKMAETPCSNRNIKNAFLFSCFTGLRVSDVDSLTWDQIVDGYIEFRQQKTSIPERVPLCGQAKEILEQQRSVGPTRKTKRQHLPGQIFFLPVEAGIRVMLKKWAKDAKITKPLSFHKARHTFATLALSSNVDIYTVSKLLGHRDLKTTQRYTQVIDEKKRQAVDLLPRI